MKGLHWFVLPLLKAHWGRNLAALIAIASGVALALAIHLVNQTAISEFQRSIARVNGKAQLQVKGSQPYFDQAVWFTLTAELQYSANPPIRELSPIIEVESSDSSGRRYKIIGLDLLRAIEVTPELIPQTEVDQIFDASVLFGASTSEGNSKESLRLNTPSGVMQFRLIPKSNQGIPSAKPEQNNNWPLIADIATVQSQFGLAKKLSRIDVLIPEHVEVAVARNALEKVLLQFPGIRVVAPEEEATRMSNLSRAYRVNLTVLALVALVTGALIVFSSQAAMVLKLWSTISLTSVLGASQRWIMTMILAQGLMLGTLGSVLGVIIGFGLASALLLTIGTDLGGGYFGSRKTWPTITGYEFLAFLLLGIVISALASWIPAQMAMQARRAEGLRPGHGEVTLSQLPRTWPALALGLLGCVAVVLPPVANLPIFSYVAIGLWLLAGIALVPWIVQRLASTLLKKFEPLFMRRPPLWLAIARISQSPGLAIQTVAGVVASMALVTAMAIMVTSFRTSVSDWLNQVLPADIYARLPIGAATLTPIEQDKINALPFVQRAEFLRSIELQLNPNRAAVPLLVRNLSAGSLAKNLPLTGSIRELSPAERALGLIPIHVSEAMVKLYGMDVGNRIALPIDSLNKQPEKLQFQVVSVWRDYARQGGAIQIDRADYEKLAGDQSATDVALWLSPNAPIKQVNEQLATVLGRPLEWRSSADIRDLSLKIFDRSFAVTYALEAAAILVALIGVAASFSAQALARQKEFAVLTHLGADNRTARHQLSIESGLMTCVGSIWGGLLGLLVSWVLVDRVNPQSFNWTMDFDIPGFALATGLVVMVIFAILSTLWATRSIQQRQVLSAIRVDW